MIGSKRQFKDIAVPRVGRGGGRIISGGTRRSRISVKYDRDLFRAPYRSHPEYRELKAYAR
eukprot:903768-Amorphochlora_amoeboformis.AAC.1